MSKLIKLNNIENLTVFQHPESIPFKIERVFVSHLEPYKVMGNHANLKSKLFCICLQGSVDVLIDDGVNKNSIQLNDFNYGVLIEKNTWREIKNRNQRSILMFLADEIYDADEYIKDYSEFIKSIQT